MTRTHRYLTVAAAILVTGVLSGIAGGFTSVVLKAIEHVTYSYTQGPLPTAVAHASIERRLFGPAIGCALAGLGWWLLRRKATIPKLTEEIRAGRPLGHGPLEIDGLLQIVAVGSGASLGREQAPRLLAASFTDLFLRLFGSIPPEHRRILLASATGAAFAAVYNVPAAGALFTLGVVLGTGNSRPLEVLVAVATSAIATVTVWPLTHGAPTFLWPDTHVTWEAFLFAVAAMPLAALVGTAFNGLIARAKPKTPPKSWTLIPAIALAGLAIGTISIWMPEMPGNGKSIVLASLAGGDTLTVVTLVMFLKPALTALFIRAGEVGGMIFPALSTGVAIGEFVAVAVNRLGGAVSEPTLALIAGAAVLAITQRAPLFAAAFAVELARPPLEVCVMLLFAAVGAHVVHTAVTRRRAANRTPAEH